MCSLTVSLCGGDEGSNGLNCTNAISNATVSKICFTLDSCTGFIFGLTMIGVLIVLALVCQCITCVFITCRKERTVPVHHKEDKEQIRVAGEEDLWYATVKFTGAAKDSNHVKKLDPESEYATVVVNTPNLDRPLLDQDCAVVGESNDICIEE